MTFLTTSLLFACLPLTLQVNFASSFKFQFLLIWLSKKIWKIQDLPLRVAGENLEFFQRKQFGSFVQLSPKLNYRTSYILEIQDIFRTYRDV